MKYSKSQPSRFLSRSGRKADTAWKSKASADSYPAAWEKALKNPQVVEAIPPKPKKTDRQMILDWLQAIGETEVVIDAVIQRCLVSQTSRKMYLRLAEEHERNT